jgi:putative transposase
MRPSPCSTASSLLADVLPSTSAATTVQSSQPTLCGTGAASQKTGSAYIEPGSPWQNAYVKSLGSRIRDELLSIELFSCLTEARVLIEDWRCDYNHHRPHSALELQAPAKFARAWKTTTTLHTTNTHRLSHTVDQ